MLVIAVTTLLAGCSLAGRPSEADLSKAIQKESNVLGVTDLPAKQADCIAAALRESKLSDDTLNAIADADTTYVNDEADAKIMAKFGEQLAKCSA